MVRYKAAAPKGSNEVNKGKFQEEQFLWSAAHTSNLSDYIYWAFIVDFWYVFQVFYYIEI